MNVLDLISGANLPVDANYLIDKLKVNKTTVYRQIDKLIQDNKIIEVELGDGKKRYEPKDLKHHHHLVCNKCGRLEDIKLDEKWIIKEVSKKTDFKVERHSLEFFGTCVNCV
jgi:Fe2+ or Zn2+ uptake regulation protein